MVAAAIVLVIVAVVLCFAVGHSEVFWRSDGRRRRAFRELDR